MGTICPHDFKWMQITFKKKKLDNYFEKDEKI